jgi:hypothetical protein
LTSHLKRTVVSKKIIKDDLSRVEESATKFTYKLSAGFERCEDKGMKSDYKFIPSSNYHKEEETIKSNKTHYPSNPKPSFNPKREVRKEPPSQEMKILFTYFMAVLVTWINFTSITRELRRDVLITPEINIVMSSLIFCLVLILMRHLAYFMYITIAHIILVHERTTLWLDALVTAHILIVVIVFHVGLIFLLEDLILTLSPDTSMVHAFPVVVQVPLDQMVRC